MYSPQPIDTSNVELPESVTMLVEQLAENAHDHWAVGRISEGWTYGVERDDTQKTNPCLVPYADLPDSEKDYDRRSAMESLKAIVALGYSIER
jgi:hypothetical protein